MKGIRIHEFGDAGVLKLEDVPDPEPGEDQALVRVHAAGVNPVDTYIRSGTYAFRPELPYTPGRDGSGIVEGTSERVYFGGAVTGSYAELAVCDRENVYPLPDRVSFDEGASLGVPYATAYRALFHCAHAMAGDRVLVHGATGGVGTAAVQLARARGLKVFATGGTEAGREMVKKQGAHHVLDHHEAGYLDRLMELTEGRGVDVVLEMLANVNLGKDLTVVARGGRVVVIGSRGPVEVNPRDAMMREASVMGMVLLNVPAEELSRIHAGIYAGLENGSLGPVIGRRFPLADAAEAHRAVMEAGAYGNIILEVES